MVDINLVMKYIDEYINRVDWESIPVHSGADKLSGLKSVKLLASKDKDENRFGYTFITDGILDCYVLSPTAYFIIDPILYILEKKLYGDLQCVFDSIDEMITGCLFSYPHDLQIDVGNNEYLRIDEACMSKFISYIEVLETIDYRLLDNPDDYNMMLEVLKSEQKYWYDQVPTGTLSKTYSDIYSLLVNGSTLDSSTAVEQLLQVKNNSFIFSEDDYILLFKLLSVIRNGMEKSNSKNIISMIRELVSYQCPIRLKIIDQNNKIVRLKDNYKNIVRITIQETFNNYTPFDESESELIHIIIKRFF